MPVAKLSARAARLRAGPEAGHIEAAQQGQQAEKAKSGDGPGSEAHGAAGTAYPGWPLVRIP